MKKGEKMYCKFCGEKLSDNCSFCPSCGKPVETAQEGANTARDYIPPTEFSCTRIQPGFSEKIDDPLIKSALKKNKKFTFVFAVVLVLAPIVVTFILSVKNDNFSNLTYGGILSLIFLLFSLVPAIKKIGKKSWDGTVVDKRTELRKENDSDGNTTRRTVYIVKFRKANGRKAKLEESEFNHIYFDYLNVGDKVRYYPQFNCFYEKYDKNQDGYAICPICSTINDISNDTCAKCGVPIIK